MTIEQPILQKVRSLSPEKQEQVLLFVELLQTDDWEQLYKGRFNELQQKIKVGIEASQRGELLDAQEVFQRLNEKPQKRQAQTGE